MYKALSGVGLSMFVLILFACISTPQIEESSFSENFTIVIESGNVSSEFFSYVEEAPDYSVFNRIVRDLSAEVEVRIQGFQMETYSSYSGYNGYAANNGELILSLDSAEKKKGFQFRVDGEKQAKSALKSELERSLAFKLMEEVKGLFLYMTSYSPNELQSGDGTLSAADETEERGPVFTIRINGSEEDPTLFRRNLITSLKRNGFRVVQPEYIERLVEINRFNLSGMTTESGEIMEFFNIQYLLSAEEDAGFYLLDVVSVHTSEIVVSFSVSKTVDKNQLDSILQKQLRETR